MGLAAFEAYVADLSQRPTHGRDRWLSGAMAHLREVGMVGEEAERRRLGRSANRLLGHLLRDELESDRPAAEVVVPALEAVFSAVHQARSRTPLTIGGPRADGCVLYLTLVAGRAICAAMTANRVVATVRPFEAEVVGALCRRLESAGHWRTLSAPAERMAESLGLHTVLAEIPRAERGTIWCVHDPHALRGLPVGVLGVDGQPLLARARIHHVACAAMMEARASAPQGRWQTLVGPQETPVTESVTDLTARELVAHLRSAPLLAVRALTRRATPTMPTALVLAGGERLSTDALMEVSPMQSSVCVLGLRQRRGPTPSLSRAVIARTLRDAGVDVVVVGAPSTSVMEAIMAAVERGVTAGAALTEAQRSLVADRPPSVWGSFELYGDGRVVCESASAAGTIRP